MYFATISDASGRGSHLYGPARYMVSDWNSVLDGGVWLLMSLHMVCASTGFCGIGVPVMAQTRRPLQSDMSRFVRCAEPFLYAVLSSIITRSTSFSGSSTKSCRVFVASWFVTMNSEPC